MPVDDKMIEAANRIEYTVTQKDARTVNSLLFYRELRKHRGTFVLTAVCIACAGTFFILHAAVYGKLSPSEVWICTPMAFWALLMVWVNTAPMRYIPRKELGSFGDFALEMGESGVKIASPYANDNVRWSRFFDVIDLNGYILFLTMPTKAIPVPRAAFATDEAYHAYFAAARRFRDASPPADLLAASRASSGGAWPPPPGASSAPLALSGPTLSADRMVEFHFGLTQAERDQAAIGTLKRIAGMGAGIVAIIALPPSIINGSPIVLAAGVTLAGATLFYFAALSFLMSKFRAAQKQIGHDSLPSDDTSVTTDFERITYQSADSAMSASIALISRVVATPSITLLFFSPQSVIPLPTRLFASPADASAFARRMRDASKAARAVALREQAGTR